VSVYSAYKNHKEDKDKKTRKGDLCFVQPDLTSNPKQPSIGTIPNMQGLQLCAKKYMDDQRLVTLRQEDFLCNHLFQFRSGGCS